MAMALRTISSSYTMDHKKTTTATTSSKLKGVAPQATAQSTKKPTKMTKTNSSSPGSASSSQQTKKQTTLDHLVTSTKKIQQPTIETNKQENIEMTTTNNESTNIDNFEDYDMQEDNDKNENQQDDEEQEEDDDDYDDDYEQGDDEHEQQDEDDDDQQDEEDQPPPTITEETQLNWVCFRLPTPLGCSNPMSFLSTHLSLIIETGSSRDHTFSLVDWKTAPDDLTSTDPIRHLLNKQTFGENTDQSLARLRKFTRDLTTVSPPGVISTLQNPPGQLLVFDANIATTGPIDAIIHDLNSYYSRRCGTIRLHPINNSRIQEIGALQYSSPNVNREELREIIKFQCAEVALYLGNFFEFLQVKPTKSDTFSKRAPKTSNPKKNNNLYNTVMIKSAVCDMDRVKKYLKKHYPSTQNSRPKHPIEYLTFRKMVFIDANNLPNDIEERRNMGRAQFSFVESEYRWRLEEFVHADTVITTKNKTNITVREALLRLTTPYSKDSEPPDKKTPPIFHDICQGTEETDISAFCLHTRLNECKILAKNWDRAFEIEFDDDDSKLLNQALLPFAVPYQGNPKMLLQKKAPPKETPQDNTNGPTTKTGNKRKKIGTPTKEQHQPMHAVIKTPPNPRRLFLEQQFALFENATQTPQAKIGKQNTAATHTAIVPTPSRAAQPRNVWNRPFATSTGTNPTPTEGNMMMVLDQFFARSDSRYQASMETIANESRRQHQATLEMAKANQRANQQAARDAQRLQLEFQARHEQQMQTINARMSRLETRQANANDNAPPSGEMEVDQEAQDASFSNENE
jgi:hypothetical protein